MNNAKHLPTLFFIPSEVLLLLLRIAVFVLSFVLLHVEIMSLVRRFSQVALIQLLLRRPRSTQGRV